MKDKTRAARQLQIEKAAYALLAQKGYGGTSMLAIAKRARCSNETLYNWYGDKLGLFRHMVSSNAEEVRQLLEQALLARTPPLKTLQAFGPVLLGVLLSQKAISLNRTAAADPSGELGKVLSEAGRETILPLLSGIFEAAKADGRLEYKDKNQAVELYLGLLVGDLQVRRVIGRIPVPSSDVLDQRAKFATEATIKLLS